MGLGTKQTWAGLLLHDIGQGTSAISPSVRKGEDGSCK